VVTHRAIRADLARLAALSARDLDAGRARDFCRYLTTAF